jgi:predicted enzyme related to lactoylglutathione lyase
MLRVIEFAFVGYPITDVARSRDFYENVLNLTPATVVDHEGRCWVEYEVGPYVLAISNMSEEWKPSSNGGGVALEVEDFDAAIAALKEKGVKFYAEPFATSVCRMALIADPDGNSICIHKRNPA